MKLYSLTHRRSSAIVGVAKGTFTSSSQEHGFEIVVSHGNAIELIVTDTETGDFKSLCHQHVFGNIRSMRAHRLFEGKFDYLVLGTDSGKFTILQYNADKKRFETQISHTYGHTGCRRTVAGELLASDPEGRAVMLGALEMQKIVYVLSRDSETPLKLASPTQTLSATIIQTGWWILTTHPTTVVYLNLERWRTQGFSQWQAMTSSELLR